MKLMLSFLRRSAALASLLLAMAVPSVGYSADQFAPTNRPQAPVGISIQQASFATYSNCPNGNCNNGGGWGWNRWGGNCNNGSCSTCNGGGLFGCGCHHGLAGGNGWVRPPAVWGLARTPNMYNYYWTAQLAGQPTAPGPVYPMVYQPTDTSQMGFYYQSVPRWYYRPSMLPPAPAPYWPLGMNTAYGAGYTGFDGNYANGGPVAAPGTAPVAPAPVVAPPPPVEPQVNVPGPEATYFPNRIRR